MKILAVLLIVLILCMAGGSTVLAQDTDTPIPANTATPTNTLTLTLSNTQRAGISTVVPPPSCGNVYNPCSGLPWAVPFFPTVNLPSPPLILLYVDQFLTATSIYTPTPGASPTRTITPSPTDTPTKTPTATPVDIGTGPISTLSGGISDTVNTLVAASTQAATLDGTEASIPELAQDFATNIPNVFSTIRGMTAATNNKTMSLVAFVFAIFIFVILVHLVVMFLPIIIRIIEFILQVISTFKPL